MRFEWDPKKAASNSAKHGVSFEEAAGVFYDSLAITGADPDHSGDEERMITFGLNRNQKLLAIAHTERDSIIRIISARKATRQERRIYEEES